MKTCVFLVISVLCLSSCLNKSETSVSFVSPQDGSVVSSPVTFEFAVKGMKVKPAGELVEGTGHHHLLVNNPSIAKGQVVPADDAHIHYGAGQTEAELELKPGKYQFTLQFADGLHRSYGEKLSQTISVTVQ